MVPNKLQLKIVKWSVFKLIVQKADQWSVTIYFSTEFIGYPIIHLKNS